MESLEQSGSPTLLGDFKNFWGKREGFAGGILIAASAVALLYGAVTFGPLIIVGLTNIYAIMALVAGLAITGFVLTRPGFWVFMWYIYKTIARKATGFFIENHPIEVMKIYALSLADQRQNIRTQQTNLRKQISVLGAKIAKNEKDSEEALEMAKEARKKGKDDVFALQSEKSGGLDEVNKTLQVLLDKMVKLDDYLTEVGKACDFYITRINNTVELEEMRKESITAAFSAFKSASKVLLGNSDGKEFFDGAVSYLERDYAEKVGEIGSFLKDSSSFMDTMSLQKGVYQERALKRLGELEGRSNSIIQAKEQKALTQEPEYIPVRKTVNNKKEPVYLKR